MAFFRFTAALGNHKTCTLIGMSAHVHKDIHACTANSMPNTLNRMERQQCTHSLHLRYKASVKVNNLLRVPTRRP